MLFCEHVQKTWSQHGYILATARHQHQKSWGHASPHMCNNAEQDTDEKVNRQQGSFVGMQAGQPDFTPLAHLAHG